MPVDNQHSIVEIFWFPFQEALMWLLGILIVIVIMYFARQPAHRFIATIFGSTARLLRQLIKFMRDVNIRLRQRNRDIMLASGRELFEYKLEKKLVRIADQVARDLSVWPSLHRDMREQISRMEQDFANAVEVPPQPPQWIQVINSVAQISAQGSDVIAKILADIHSTLKQAMDKSMIEYRFANRNRYALLNRMIPQWRGMYDNLDGLDKKIHSFNDRAITIDHHIELYQQILQGTEQAMHTLNKSAASNLILSSLLLMVAAAGGVINFQLLALPLSEVVGVHGYTMGMHSSDVATMVIVCLQIILGLFLLEAAGVTRLLPDIALLDRRKRRSVMYLMVVLLLIMAGMEALLVYTRDALVTDNESLNKLLAMSDYQPEVSLSWIPALGQVVIGFALPLLLIFSIIALENFINAFRTASSMFISWLIDVQCMLLRLLATLILAAGRLFIAVYDLIIFFPVYLERIRETKKHRLDTAAKNKSAESDQ